MSGPSNSDVREIVWREIVKRADYDDEFRGVVDRFGIFKFMTMLDGIVDCVIVALPEITNADTQVAKVLRELADDVAPQVAKETP